MLRCAPLKEGNPMALSLYDVTVPTFTQTLGALSGVLTKAEAHCGEKSMSPEDWVGARLFSDMAPLSFQVRQTVAHSAGALEAVQAGVFSPDLAPPPETFAGLK